MNKNDVMTNVLRPEVAVKLFLYLLFAWLIYDDMLGRMVVHWQREDYNYGYLLPLVLLYLVWDMKAELAAIPGRPSWFGLVPVSAGILLFLFGELGGEYLVLYLSLWTLAAGLCWLHFGWARLKRLTFVFIMALPMFPLPFFFHNRLTLELKLISSQIGVKMMQALGISAFRDGNVIDLGYTQLQVVDACSGLRYVIPLIIMGLLVAYLSKLAFWKKCLIVLSTVPISIAVNSLRIASVGLLYPIWGASVVEGFFHDFSGWLIFMLSLALLLFEVWLLKRFVFGQPQHKEAGAPGKETLTAKPNPGNREIRDAENENSGAPPKRSEKRKGLGRILGPPQFVVVLIMLTLTVVVSQGVEFREKTPISQPLMTFPREIGPWKGVSQTMAQEFVSELNLSDYVIIDYQNPEGLSVNFYAAYYESQSKGESIHSPATCLPGGGWKLRQTGSTRIPIAHGTQSTMPVNRAFMQKGDARQLTYYWFPQRGRILTNAYELKLFAFWDALTKQRTDGALVRVITPVYPLEDVDKAEERLIDFLKQALPVFDEFIPGSEVQKAKVDRN